MEVKNIISLLDTLDYKISINDSQFCLQKVSIDILDMTICLGQVKTLFENDCAGNLRTY